MSWLLIGNRLKGAGVNAEGSSFVPIGWYLLFVAAVLMLIEVIFIFSVKKSIKTAVISAVMFLVGMCGEMIVWEFRYSTHHILNFFA